MMSQQSYESNLFMNGGTLYIPNTALSPIPPLSKATTTPSNHKTNFTSRHFGVLNMICARIYPASQPLLLTKPSCPSFVEHKLMKRCPRSVLVELLLQRYICSKVANTTISLVKITGYIRMELGVPLSLLGPTRF
jgi:hypothetical protein